MVIGIAYRFFISRVSIGRFLTIQCSITRLSTNGIRCVIFTTVETICITGRTNRRKVLFVVTYILTFHVCHNLVFRSEIEDGFTTIVIICSTCQTSFRGSGILLESDLIRAQKLVAVFHTLETIELAGGRLVHMEKTRKRFNLSGSSC